MFSALVKITRRDDVYFVTAYLAQQKAFFRVYDGKTGRKAALNAAARQATLRKCGIAPKFSLTKDEQTRLALAGVALVNE